ncbi:hypothetical protein IPN35_03980 [Candidatus Peregrinibacteria bacterium]|nr:MAG: hypothetical protein IPN35_03980 [Candidatus Peregrinibacteria bacterium]
MNSKQDIIGRKEKRRAILFVVFVILFFFSAYIYNNRAFVLMRAGSFFNIEEFILPASLDFQVLKKIGNTEYIQRLDDGSLYFQYSKDNFPINDHIINFKVDDIYIYILEKPKGNHQSIRNDFRYYVLDYKQQGKDLRKYYKKIEDFPTFAKINSETGDTWWYHNFEEMNEEDRKIFQELLDEEKEKGTLQEQDEKRRNKDDNQSDKLLL